MSQPDGPECASNVLNSATNNFGVLEGSRLDMTRAIWKLPETRWMWGSKAADFLPSRPPGGTRYTRNGSFHVSSSGVLVTAAGDPVLGDLAFIDKYKNTDKKKGVIDVPAGAVSIASDGTLSVNGAVAGTIQLVEFAAGTKLTSEGGTLIAAPEGSAKADAAAGAEAGRAGIFEREFHRFGGNPDRSAAPGRNAATRDVVV